MMSLRSSFETVLKILDFVNKKYVVFMFKPLQNRRV